MKVEAPRDCFKKFLESHPRVLIGDANFFIPLNRIVKGNKQGISFQKHKSILLDPFIEMIELLYVHQSVYDEIENIEIKEFIDSNDKIIIVSEEDLKPVEKRSFRTIENVVSSYTNYKPTSGCFKDKGEVHSIAYAATNNIDFFITIDQGAISLFDNTNVKKYVNELDVINLYEIIYFLYINNEPKQNLRNVYRYMYHSSERDHKTNPSWEEFITLFGNYYGE